MPILDPNGVPHKSYAELDQEAKAVTAAVIQALAQGAPDNAVASLPLDLILYLCMHRSAVLVAPQLLSHAPESVAMLHKVPNIQALFRYVLEKEGWPTESEAAQVVGEQRRRLLEKFTTVPGPNHMWHGALNPNTHDPVCSACGLEDTPENRASACLGPSEPAPDRTEYNVSVDAAAPGESYTVESTYLDGKLVDQRVVSEDHRDGCPAGCGVGEACADPWHDGGPYPKAPPEDIS